MPAAETRVRIMARRSFEYRPDKTEGSFLSRLLPTKKQRQKLLKWSLYSLLLLVLSLLQDVLLCKVRILGTTTDLVPCCIMLICMLEGAQRSSIFCVAAALCFVASGSSPGYYVMPVITLIAMVVTMFRQGYLRLSFGTVLACLAVALFAYEMTVFTVEWLSGRILPERMTAFSLKAVLSLAVAPLLYPMAAAIEKIGGETWKE